MNTIRITLPLSDEFLNDVICTAAEGGITYWASLRPDVDDFREWEEIEASDDEFGARTFALTADTITMGILRALTPGFAINAAVRAAIVSGVTHNDAADIDADAADVIVQAAVFGEIVYG